MVKVGELMKFTIKIIKNYTFWVILGTLIGILLHIGLIWLDSSMVEKPIYIDLDKKFWQSAFSFPFLPILILEIFLSVSTIFLWMTTQKALQRAHLLDMEKINYDTTVKTFQDIMSLLATHIASNNNKILEKIEFRKNKGQQVSTEIEKSSQNIAKILQVLSEISFVEPYITKNNNKKKNLVKELEKRIEETLCA